MGMSIGRQVAMAIVVGIVAWFLYGRFVNGPEWEVSPEQIAAAQAAGKPGYESSPGTVTVLPIRSETAGIDKLLQVVVGAGAGLVTFGAMRKRPAKAA